MKSYRKQGGLSLVELMVSILIASFVLGGVVSVVVTSRDTYESEQAASYLQDNARFAIETIARDLRLSGNLGCVPRENSLFADIVPLSIKNNGLISTDPIRGYEGTAAATLIDAPPVFANNVTAGTDALIVRFTEPASAAIISNHDPATQSFTVPGGAFSSSDALVIAGANCRRAGLFINTGGSATDVSYALPSGLTCDAVGAVYPATSRYDCSATVTPNGVYPAGSELMRYLAHGYYIGDSTVTPGVPALKRHVVAGATSRVEELAQGVENLDVLYGIDAVDDDGFPDRFYEADSVPDWDEVVAVDITMVLRSPTELLSPDQRDAGAADGFLRQSTSMTVHLRNL